MRIAMLILLASALLYGGANTSASFASTAAKADMVGGATLPAGPELTALHNSCEICHSFDMVTSQRLSKAIWAAEVTKMTKWGSPLPKKQQASVVAYLAKYLGPTVPRTGAYPRASAPPESVPSAH